MWLLYLLALILGGGFLLVQLVAGGHHDTGHDFSHDLGHDGENESSHPYTGPGVLSIRSATYGLFVFGAVGGALHVLGLASPALALAAGAVSGAVTTFFVGLTFKRLADPGATGEAGFHEAEGRVARVLVACARGSHGKVRVLLKGQQVDMLATTDDDLIPAGAQAVVLEVRDHVVHVTRAGG